MKKVTNFKHARIGDWFLLIPPIVEGVKDKRKTIIIINNGELDMHFLNVKGEFSSSKLAWKTNELNLIVDFYSSWDIYKLNQEDKERLNINKELILANL